MDGFLCFFGYTKKFHEWCASGYETNFKITGGSLGSAGMGSSFKRISNTLEGVHIFLLEHTDMYDIRKQ